jgi:predicted transcriptional regulator
MPANKVVLMSVKPEFASRILDGSKTVELRRQLPRLGPGDLIALYVSSPVKKLVATLEVVAIEADEPSNLWHVVSAYAGVSRREYDEYFAGAKQAVGIVLSNIRRRPTPLSLSKLRDLIEGFTAPQSYRYLCDVERSALGI